VCFIFCFFQEVVSGKLCVCMLVITRDLYSDVFSENFADFVFLIYWAASI